MISSRWLARISLLLLDQAVPGLLTPSSTTSSCSSPIAPLAVAVRNITLANQFVKRGIAVQVGEPPQNLAFLPSTVHNNTFLYDANSFCDEGDTMTQCSAKHGGFFDSGASSTWSPASSYRTLRGAEESDTTLYRNPWGSDQISLNTSFSLPDFPVSIEKFAVQGNSVIGLGSNSTFVTALFDMGAIASRTWSLAWGWTGQVSTRQIYGNMVFGGYDAAKSKGPNVTVPFSYDRQCPSGLVVTINDINLNLQNGSNPSIFGTGRGSALRACLSPHYPLITIPEDIYNRFLEIGGGTFFNRSVGNGFWGMNFEAKEVYDGDVSFQLSDEVTVRIPNHQLVVPDYSVNTLGQYDIGNNSVREVLFNSLQDVNKEDLPLLGMPFMTSAYLSVDLDKEVFSLAQYAATTESDIVPLSSSECRPDPRVTTRPSNPSNGSQIASEQTKAKPSPNNANTIAGAVVGALCFFATMAALALYWHRRQARRKEQDRVSASVATMVSDRRLSNPFYYNPELASDRQPPQELPVTKDQPTFLPPYELQPKTPRLAHTERAPSERYHD